MQRTLSAVTSLVLFACVTTAAIAVEPRDDVASVITSGQWIKDLGKPPFHEQYVYTFAKDGGYIRKLITDFNAPDVKGKWALAKGQDGQTRLQLTDQKEGEDYYWLQQESVIRYDSKRDVLVISGERYFGDQTLRHHKDDTSSN